MALLTRSAARVTTTVVVDEPWLAIVIGVATALGTLTLAFFTWRLARSTKADVEAQWRPLLVPTELAFGDGSGAKVPSGWGRMAGEDSFSFAISNVGKGPAIDVRAFFRNPPGGMPVWENCLELPSPILAVGDRDELMASGGLTGDGTRIHVKVTYADLAGNLYETEVYYVHPSGDPRWRVELVVPRSSGPRLK